MDRAHTLLRITGNSTAATLCSTQVLPMQGTMVPPNRQPGSQAASPQPGGQPAPSSLARLLAQALALALHALHLAAQPVGLALVQVQLALRG